MDETNYKMDRVLTPKEVLTYYLNKFTDKLLGHVIDLEHYSYIKSINPGYATVNQMGQQVTVDQLIENCRNGIMYARENKARVERLLEADEKGTLAERFTDKAIGRETIADVLGQGE